MNATDIERCRKRIIQYIWDPEPKNDEEPGSPIWCLGTRYPPQCVEETADESRNPDHGQQQNTNTSAPGWPEAFLLDFESKIWMTYRSNFPPIPKDAGQEGSLSLTLGVRLRSQLIDAQGFTSDTGWGCMIRSGQSLLANSMAILLLGRDWRRGERLEEEGKLLSLFADSPHAPFSIHSFVKHGADFCGKHPGEWFGPTATARCIQGLAARYDQSNLQVYIADDNSDVHQDKFMSVSRDEKGTVRPTLILLGLRLGIDRITAVYWNGLKAVLQLPQSVGIAGGRPSASHYFVAVQGSHFFYLDPHNTRPALRYSESGTYTEDEVNTYHTRRLRRLNIQDMDPSMLIGFLIRDEDDWEDWKARIMSLEGKPIITILSESDAASWKGRREALDEVEAFDDLDVAL
ncbi:cysteine protease ATG4 [Aspergillus nidulans FGSC A4]|uniref:Cysteine protease atg4 n=1 Tax=Emericella nidulans (strain FGSC A4 / ATCC 38163 / CBS 112.46 / NRRL 194 / M139) TaxID=227321 RepID=ATG4_EMENI|nr:cysteine protease ATG4 [Aspergillus nidulans FGSC A4]Q5B7L0.2 RecName: Full=Cysteine protease atg4; AltName: Full=Autophagy-related protein 4 [Aspergillus nidulans FGSC A4]CBF82642.1 TPA: Cysteine protease atg4 (EC 3.4.22.-)(Autophagy-related protein 4) [Source:UniProtKB/Swiss-Prot;Acc:Q5B7L0] [Aspergillus nidulans FGSC A4]